MCVSKESLWLLSGEQTWGAGAKVGAGKPVWRLPAVQRLDSTYIFKDKLMGFPNILDVGVRGKERGWIMIKLTLYGNHLQSARVGADVTTGPENEEEELTK